MQVTKFNLVTDLQIMLSNVTHSNFYFECNKERGPIDQLYIELGCQPYPRHGPLKVNQLKNDSFRQGLQVKSEEENCTNTYSWEKQISSTRYSMSCSAILKSPKITVNKEKLYGKSQHRHVERVFQANRLRLRS